LGNYQVKNCKVELTFKLFHPAVAETRRKSWEFLHSKTKLNKEQVALLSGLFFVDSGFNQ
jgi:hypothetical protein